MKIKSSNGLRVNWETGRAIRPPDTGVRISCWHVKRWKDTEYADTDGGYAGWVTSSASALKWLSGESPQDLIEDEF